MDEIVHPVPEDQIPIQRDFSHLDESIRGKEQEIRKLETKSAQNANLYFIFQAVILMSTATATSLTCNHWWIPFLVSLLAAVQNFYAFARTMIRVLKLREKLDQDSLDLAFMKLYGIRKDQVNQVVPGAKFNQFQYVSSQAAVKEGNEIRRPKPGPYQKWRGRLLAYCPLALFVLFSGLVMYGCHILLCHNNGGKCVKVC